MPDPQYCGDPAGGQWVERSAEGETVLIPRSVGAGQHAVSRCPRGIQRVSSIAASRPAHQLGDSDEDNRRGQPTSRAPASRQASVQP